MRVTGAAQDSGGALSECPEGPANPTGASRVAVSAAARDGGTPENREAVETARREPQTRDSSYEFRDRFARRQKPTRVGQEGETPPVIRLRSELMDLKPFPT
jgi:hypothetical protein